MTYELEDQEGLEGTFVDQEDIETFKFIIAACGDISLKEKVNMLYLTIDYIFYTNRELIPALSDKVTIH